MKLDQGITKVYSWAGFFSTILIILIIGVYTGQKINVLRNHTDIDILETELVAYFD